MKRRNFLKLGAMAAVAAVLPKTTPRAERLVNRFPNGMVINGWGGIESPTWFDAPVVGQMYLPGDTVYFINAAGLKSGPKTITGVHSHNA